MVTQQVLLCDDQGKFNGKYLEKEKAHTGKGKKHLAITVLIYNNKGEVLLQKRKHQIFDDIWDLTGATHPLRLEDGHDETFEEATLRCLQREYNIEPQEVENLKNLGTFNYFARDNEQKRIRGRKTNDTHFAQYGKLCENECCAMMVGFYDGDLNLNEEVGYKYKWMEREEFLKDIQANPQKYTPWAIEGIKLL